MYLIAVILTNGKRYRAVDNDTALNSFTDDSCLINRMSIKFTEMKHITANVNESFTDDSCFINHISMMFTEMMPTTAIVNESFTDDSCFINRISMTFTE